MSLRTTDEDFAVDDKIGDCWALPEESDLGSVVEANCTTADLRLFLSLKPSAK